MPRNTRAAMRSKEPGIEIATDETQTMAPASTPEPEKGIERPALVELTANAVDEIELSMELKAEKKGKGTAKRPKANGTVKGSKTAKKGRMPESSKPREVVTVIEPIDLMDKSGAAEHGASLDQETNGASDAADAAALVSTPIFAELSTANRSASPSPTQNAAIDDEKASEPSAVQQLESLFEKPAEPADDQALKEIAITTAAVAASAGRKKADKAFPTEKAAKTKTVVKAVPKTKSPFSTKASTLKSRDVHGAAKPKSRPSTISTKRVASTTIKSRPSSTLNAKTSSPQKAASPERTTSIEKKRTSIAALSTPPKLAKSTKPLTTSTFKLPGEALQEKFKAQREERLKRQEEQAQKQKENPARPSIPPKHTTKPRVVPEVRPTKASAFRLSTSVTLKDRPNGLQVNSPIKKAATMKAVRRTSTSARGGTISKAARPSVGAHSRTVSAASKPEIAPPTITMTATEKAEAARKARAEAAERGRAASKAWAEKRQKEVDAKKAAASSHAAAAAPSLTTSPAVQVV